MNETYSNIYLSSLFFSVKPIFFCRTSSVCEGHFKCWRSTYLYRWVIFIDKASFFSTFIHILPFIVACLINFYFSTILRGPFRSFFHMVGRKRSWNDEIEPTDETNIKQSWGTYCYKRFLNGLKKSPNPANIYVKFEYFTLLFIFILNHYY